MEKITYAELAELFRQHESTCPTEHLTGCIVFTEDSFEKPYPLEARSYVVSSNNKAYLPGMIGGYSIFGSALDGSDKGVRLEAYMAAERGGKDGWKVEYCYLME